MIQNTIIFFKCVFQKVLAASEAHKQIEFIPLLIITVTTSL